MKEMRIILLMFKCRSFDPVVPVPDDIQEVMKDVHRRVFAVLLRLSTHKEDSVSAGLV